MEKQNTMIGATAWFLLLLFNILFIKNLGLCTFTITAQCLAATMLYLMQIYHNWDK